ncbi:MAG: histone H1-like repetitive region-containing protein [Deltaproteobacteria bacterium]
MTRLEERIRIGIVGLGWVGQEVARAALEDPRVTLVGIADADPNKADRDLGELIGEGRLGVPVERDVEAMLARARPEVAVVTTTSDVEALGPTLEACVAVGAHVVTTCENLADADMATSQLEPGFDERVRDAGVVVLATGVNPGFAMDRLPVMLAQATRNIRRIRVTRVVDAASRRAQLQAKVGVGMTPHAFTEAIKSGEIGHAGLSASLRLIAKGLGIHLEKTSEAFSPVLAASPTTSTLGTVASGRVRGIYQIARGYRHGREIITLELTMALDEEHARDTIDIVGEPPLHFEGELPGDDCTVATVLSAISVVVTMPPGLRTVLDVPLEQPEEPAPLYDSNPPRRRDATQLPGPRAKRASRRRPTVAAADDSVTALPMPVDEEESVSSVIPASRRTVPKGAKADGEAEAEAPAKMKASRKKAAASSEASATAEAAADESEDSAAASSKDGATAEASSKKASSKKSASKKASSKKSASKKASSKKSASKKAPSKKASSKKASSKKSAAKKASSKKSASKKASSKKSASKKSASKKASSKKDSSKEGASKKASSKKSASKKVPSKKASSKKSASKKASSKKSASKKASRKGASNEGTAKSSSKRSSSKKGAASSPSKKSASKKSSSKKSASKRSSSKTATPRKASTPDAPAPTGDAS